MSGIAGIIDFDGRPADRGRIMQLTDAMANRGPHGIDHWAGGSVALGHCMLRTTPESLDEEQPLKNEDESLILVMDGRIDNGEDLRTELRSAGAMLRTRSDPELVLRAYETWGEACLSHLDGDFALAIWNKKNGRLFCARDRFGVKPFYYHRGKTFLAFASDEEAFSSLAEVPLEANEDRIACAFVHQFDGVDFDDSWLKGIVKLSPATSMSISLSGYTQTRRYWCLEPKYETPFGSDEACEETFRGVFCGALQRRMRSIHAPAMMLSGGIDSAIIAGAVQHSHASRPAGKLHTFSVVSDDDVACGETRNIRKIIQGHECHGHLIGASSYAQGVGRNDLREAAWAHTHPVVNSILLPAMMYLAASRLGHNVMFDGIDGDIITDSPQRYYTQLMRSGAWSNSWRECRLASVHHTYLRGHSPLVLASLGLWDLVAPYGLKRMKTLALEAIGKGILSDSLINPDFAKRISLMQRLHAWWEQRDARSLSEAERHIREATPIGLARGMEGFDRVAARYGVEPRHPWVDRRLIEFYVNLPLRMKVRDGWTKYLVRTASSPWLEGSVRWNSTKDHLGWQMTRGLMVGDRDVILSTLKGQGRDTLREYVDIRRLDRLLYQYEHRVMSDPGVEQLFRSMSIALWLLRLSETRLSHNKWARQRQKGS